MKPKRSVRESNKYIASNMISAPLTSGQAYSETSLYVKQLNREAA